MEKKTRKSQCDRIMDYMRTHSGITDNEARDELHCNRLSGRIYDLKKRGVPIAMEWRFGKNVYGEKVKYAFYYFPEGDAKCET